jgi:16S rRNA processing protein RimM
MPKQPADAQRSSTPPKDEIGRRAIGRIVAAHGIKGEVKVEPYTDFRSRFQAGTSLLLRGEPCEVEAVRWTQAGLLLKLRGVETRNTAEALQWETLSLVDDSQPDLGEDEYVVDDLVGLLVVDESGAELGRVEDVLPYPAHDVLVVQRPSSEGSEPILIPAIHEFVLLVDLDAETITVRLIDGMAP